MRLVQTGKRDAAMSALAGEFVVESESTMKHLYAMKRVASGQAAPQLARYGPNRATNVTRLQAKPAARTDTAGVVTGHRAKRQA